MLLVSLLLLSTFDALSLPIFRLSIGEFLTILLLLFRFKTYPSFLLKSPSFGFLLLYFYLLIFHQIIASFIWNTFPYLQAFVRPFLYSSLAILIYQAFLNINVSKIFLLKSIRVTLLIYSGIVIMQKLFPFLILPLLNPSFGINSLVYTGLPSGLTVEPSFVGGFIASFYCLLIFWDQKLNYSCLFFALIACIASGSRTGLLILVLVVCFYILRNFFAYMFRAIVLGNSIPLGLSRFVYLLFFSFVLLLFYNFVYTPFSGNFSVRLINAFDGIQNVFLLDPSYQDISVGARMTSQLVYHSQLIKLISFYDLKSVFGYGIFQSSYLISANLSSSQFIGDNLVPFNFFYQFLVELGVFSLFIILSLFLRLRLTPFPFSLIGFALFASTCNVLNFFWSYVFIAVFFYASFISISKVSSN